jgi:hypothetical protein
VLLSAARESWGKINQVVGALHQTKLRVTAAFDHIAADKYFATSRLDSSLRENRPLFIGLLSSLPADKTHQ